MAFSRHTVGDQSPSERLCLYPDSGSLTRARNLVRGSHLDVLSAMRGSASWCQLPRYRLVGSEVESAGRGMFRFPEAAALLRGCKTMRVRLLEPLAND